MTVPDWLLERYALGEVTDAERALVEADPDHRDQLEGLRSSDAAIRREHHGSVVAERARARAHTGRSVPWGLWVPALGIAAAVLLVVLGRTDGDGTRAKGAVEPALVLHRQVGAGSEVLRDGDLAHPGDVLQIEAVGAGHPYGWVISVDGAGAVTVHNDGVLGPGASRLPSALVLDDAPGFEHFWLVVHDRPIPRDVVERAAADARPRADGRGVELDVPGMAEVGVWVQKP